MLTLNQETPRNTKSNYKLLLGALASTAVICAGTAYFVAESKSTNTGNSNLFSLLPDEFTGSFQFEDTDKYRPNAYSISAVFNKHNDEFGEWTMEGRAIETDKTRARTREFYLKDDKYYVYQNKSMDCLPEYKQLGYATYKNNILSAVNIKIEEIDPDVQVKVQKVCSEDAPLSIMQTDDYGIILMCAEQKNDHIEAGIVHDSFIGKFSTLPEKINIELPTGPDLVKTVGLTYMDHTCETADKFQTQKSFGKRYMTTLEVDDKVKQNINSRVEVGNFPFTTMERTLKGRAPMKMAREPMMDFDRREFVEQDIEFKPVDLREEDKRNSHISSLNQKERPIKFDVVDYYEQSTTSASSKVEAFKGREVSAFTLSAKGGRPSNVNLKSIGGGMTHRAAGVPGGGKGGGYPTSHPIAGPVRNPIGQLPIHKGPTPAPTPDMMAPVAKGPPPPRPGVHCYWMHGAGNHRGMKRDRLRGKDYNMYANLPLLKKPETKYMRSAPCTNNVQSDYTDLHSNHERCLYPFQTILRTNQDWYHNNLATIGNIHNGDDTKDALVELQLNLLVGGGTYDDVLFMHLGSYPHSQTQHGKISVREMGDYWAGSACLYRNRQEKDLKAKLIKKGDQTPDSWYKYPRCEEAFYPYFINGGMHYQSGVLGDVCKRGLFWSTNTANEGVFSAPIKIRASNFLCDDMHCEFGPAVGRGFPGVYEDPTGPSTKTSIVFGHSYGCLAIYSTFASGYVIKGPRGFIGLSQGPVRGSSAAQFSHTLCLNSFWPGIGAGEHVLKFLAIKEIQKIFQSIGRTIGYCERVDKNMSMDFNNQQIGKAKDVWWPSMAHDVHFGRPYETSLSVSTETWWKKDFNVEFKYCGAQPAGMYYDYLGTIADAVGDYINNGSLTSMVSDFDGMRALVESLMGGSDNYIDVGGMAAPDVNMMNSMKLYGLSIAPCLLYNHCQQMSCRNLNYISCTFAGCHTKMTGNNLMSMSFNGGALAFLFTAAFGPGVAGSINQHINLPMTFRWDGNPECRHERLKDWIHNDFEFATDGMVNVNACIGVDWGNQYANNDEVWDAGMSTIILQQSNHEDGTGCNGNSWAVDRRPINWYSMAILDAKFYTETAIWKSCQAAHGDFSLCTQPFRRFGQGYSNWNPITGNPNYLGGSELTFFNYSKNTMAQNFQGFVDESKFSSPVYMGTFNN